MATEIDSNVQPISLSPDGKLEFERDIPNDFREAWPDQAEISERGRLIRGRLVRRVHWDRFELNNLNNIVFGGPIFDANLMVQSIINQMESLSPVGYSWAIVRYGQLVDAGGIGDARAESESNSRVMTENTRMVSASLAKPVCAVTIMKLIEDNVISLKDLAYPFIQEAFPNVDPSIEAISIHHLLTHTSGINGSGLLSNFGSVLQQPTDNPPGIKSRYENANYWFLAYVVEGATGIGYSNYARDNILVPMTITSMNNQVDDNAPCLYYAANSVSNGETWGDFESTAIGAYGWYASAIDWAKFMAYFRFDQVLNKHSRLTMLDSSESYFGFRHWNSQPRGSYYGHGGDLSRNGKAFHGGMMGFPDGVDAVLLTNSDEVKNPENILIQAYHDAYA